MHSNKIEEHAAKAIGFIIFEFTRLDMELGLYLVWSNEGKELEKLTVKLSEENFNSRLKFLEKLVCEKFERSSPERNKYRSWLLNAHEVRSLRNQLVHGRWGFIPSQECVANVIRLPTSAEQSETCYSIKQLDRIVERIKKLRFQLSELRESFPV